MIIEGKRPWQFALGDRSDRKADVGGDLIQGLSGLTSPRVVPLVSKSRLSGIGGNSVKQRHIHRRHVLLGASALAALPSISRAQPGPAIHVLKDPNCGCCAAWIEILEEEGFRVTTESSFGTDLIRQKLARGIPQEMVSCHTADVEGYAIEGHVPRADIRRLLFERPDAVGLAVPGMPYGSPGMGPESRREAYDVHLIRPDGSTEVFTHYEAA